MQLIVDVNNISKNELNKSIVSNLEKKGVVIIRNLFKNEKINFINKNWSIYFKHPSISGSVGYSQTSQKKLVNSAFLLGKHVLDIALNLDIIKSIENYMSSECTLAEANAILDKASSYEYFPVHSDFAVGWKKSKEMKKPLSLSQMKKPLGVGAILYLHDTEYGCFKYSLGSHKMLSPYGQKLKTYPQELKNKILKNMYKCKGLAGDLVLFDDRGFHGPDQPSLKDRKVIILDYTRDKTFGSIIVEPHKVKINDLSSLSKKQLRVLGMNASPIVKSEDYVFTRYKKNFFFPILSWVIKNSYIKQHIKNVIKHNLLKLRIKI